MKRSLRKSLARPLAAAACVVLFWFALGSSQLRAQTLTNQTEPPQVQEGTGNDLTADSTLDADQTREGRVLIPDSALVDDQASPLVSQGDLPREVLLKIRRFELFREQYLRRQAELFKLYRGATDEERARLRERFQRLHEEWQRRALDFRQQARERQAELLDKLPAHREALRDAVRESRERAVEQVQEGRKRIGDE